MTSDLEQRPFAGAIERDRRRVEARCGELLGRFLSGPEIIREAVRYTLLGGGKRLRPILCLWTHGALNGKRADACLDTACAIECLHTYTLVHDDLPCMDDDDMRRGKPSCHKKFGDAIAVLTGDALLTLCFEILSSLKETWNTPDSTIVELVKIFSRAGGTRGLIAGQVLDLDIRSAARDIEAVENIHRHKTAALVAASMEAGAVLAAAGPAVRNRVARAGSLAGQAFQIIDDVLDLQMDLETLGKTPRKDLKDGKLTYPSVAGIEDSRKRAAALVREAREEMGTEIGGTLIGELFDYMVTRRA